MKNREALGTRRLLKIWRPSENVGRKMDFEAVHTWTRGEVSSCNCSEKTYRHVHCRCLRCKGKATTRSIELRHWSEARLLDAGATGTVEFNFHSGGGSDTNGPEEGMDIGEERTDLLEVLEMDENPDVESDLVEKDASNNCNTENVNPLKKLVFKAVLEALSIMDNSGASIKTFEDILAYGKAMLLESISSDTDVDILLALWPKDWKAVQLLLEEQGYSDAKEFYICICREEKEVRRCGKTSVKYNYSRSWSVMSSKDELCPHCGNGGYIKYYYLGLSSKVKNWFKTKSMCRKMLSHWKEKEHWLGRSSSWPLKKEFWDGQRWVDLQWFFDPNQTWLLPGRCGNCKAVISAESIASCEKAESGLSYVKCPECMETVPCEVKTANGSPLNVALVGHWDAWQPFKTGLRSCGSIEISIANMCKEDRTHVEEVYVVGFVPCTSVPNNVPEAYDPFLEPLMHDLCKGFIDGFEVTYPPGVTIADYEPREVETVRVLLLCWTADHPGQCEFGKFLNQGKCGCRRCKVTGQQSEYCNRYYYGNNLYHCRYPWARRNIQHELDNLYDVDNETRKSVRKTLSSEIGFTGTSVFHRYLYPLYGFDILQHMLIDVFHTVLLNLCKNQTQRMLELELIDITYLDEKLKSFPWTNELKNGRIPVAVGKEGKGLNYWKAEGFQKFFFPMLECIVEGKMENLTELEIVCSVSRFVELHFTSGRDGWSDEMIEMHRKLAQRINVKIEETQGLDMCTVSVHNMLHIHEDIINFSATDNYWCAVFERAVKDYIKRSNNCKGVEATFAKAEARREFLKSLEEEDDSQLQESNTSQGVVRSVEMARAICRKDGQHSLLLGSSKRVCQLTRDDHIKIAAALSLSPTEISAVPTITKKCFLINVGHEGVVLSSKDSIIVTFEGSEEVVSVHHFLSVRHEGGNCLLLGEGSVKPFLRDGNGLIAVNFWNGFPKVEMQPDSRTVFFSTENISRNVMLYDCGNNTATVVDYMRKLRSLPYELIVPVYPEKDDMLLIQGELPGDIWYGKALDIDWERLVVDIVFFVEKHHHPGRYERETLGRTAVNKVSLDSVTGVAQGQWISTNCWQKNI